MKIATIGFETAVVGVIAPFGRGVVRGCVECRASSVHPAPCNGYGPGCLVAPRPLDARPTTAIDAS